MICSVCGMDVNGKNYNLNEFAFLEKNTLEEISFCPFCGAGIKYMKENYNLNRKKWDDNTYKILDHAVKLELFNGDFYYQASIMAHREEVKEMFEALSRIENFHAKIHEKLGKFKEMPSLNKVSYSKYNSDEALLELAQKKEEHAVAYYEKYKKELEDINLVKIFEVLADVEKKHIILTSK